ncbi:hypothetical protein K2Z83_21325 [Oscillochloris sp. ZM17-4]|uniref:hypothetical protein n=1 Tax=Oscillochloris sp. ZM17-4 TaxID=2866714 RepID=UPI001C730C68|nr:hypothetical protein [Oscillochloris sp. ZM17-4]MBX0330215.1 hypothetical protein [Oscillochloris sp. ZM17-4]
MTTLPLRVEARYTRSVHLQRDFAGRANLDGYQITPLVIQTVERIMAGLEPEATGRAFTLIGPYGAGKSAFGVFLARFLSLSEQSRKALVQEHAAQELPQRPIYRARTLLPILVSGSEIPKAKALGLPASSTRANHDDWAYRVSTGVLCLGVSRRDPHIKQALPLTVNVSCGVHISHPTDQPAGAIHPAGDAGGAGAR